MTNRPFCEFPKVRAYFVGACVLEAAKSLGETITMEDLIGLKKIPALTRARRVWYWALQAHYGVTPRAIAHALDRDHRGVGRAISRAIHASGPTRALRDRVSYALPRALLEIQKVQSPCEL